MKTNLKRFGDVLCPSVGVCLLFIQRKHNSHNDQQSVLLCFWRNDMTKLRWILKIFLSPTALKILNSYSSNTTEQRWKERNTRNFLLLLKRSLQSDQKCHDDWMWQTQLCLQSFETTDPLTRLNFIISLT